LQNLRKEYKKGSLTEQGVNKNPFKQFKKWFDEAVRSGKFLMPNSMTLATSAKSGKPTARIVLLKGYNENGFVFYTNYKSRKGKEIEQNPFGCVLFYWDKLERQVRIEGSIKKLTKRESEDYFKTRPYESRLGAWASNQSSVIKDRKVLESSYLKFAEKYSDEVPLPAYWGGYRLVPGLFEFWQGGKNRLHDRIRYKRKVKAGKLNALRLNINLPYFQSH
jgi:pyridoxamine 5'-phosphate oxidase